VLSSPVVLFDLLQAISHGEMITIIARLGADALKRPNEAANAAIDD